MRVHELKTWPAPFAAVLSGAKRHEIRRDDRGFMVGDELDLREWDPSRAQPGLKNLGYTGKRIRTRVTYVSEGGTWGLPPGLCVMSIEPVDEGAP